MNEELFNEATKSNVLTKKLIDQLLESMTYSSISFINWTIETLSLIKARLQRGDRITDEVIGEVYTLYSFQQFVEKNFSSYIASQVFKETSKPEKIYFSLKPCEEGYSLMAADSDSNKTYAWISSLSKRFSLVEMIATGIVYVKDTRTNTYQPFISGKGKYCKYDKEKGILVEI
ncbi:MAG: hypothetical protein ACLU9T_08885 [Blautia faecis]